MADRVLCLDTSVLVKYLTREEGHQAAARVIGDALERDDLLVAPAWAWAEVGSVLRKKVGARLLRGKEADLLWSLFLELPIAFLDSPEIRTLSWRIAERYALSTLYDAGFLACLEARGTETVTREFWTADRELVRQLGARRPAYIRELAV